MTAALAQMATADSEADYMRHDTEFHIAVARGAHNRFAVRQIEEIRMGLNETMSLLPESDAWHERIDREHADIAAAIQRGDGDAGARAMEVHVAGSEQGLRAVLAAIRRRPCREAARER